MSETKLKYDRVGSYATVKADCTPEEVASLVEALQRTRKIEIQPKLNWKSILQSAVEAIRDTQIKAED